MKIYLVLLESNVDGEYYFDVVPCLSMDAAKKVLKEEKNWVLKNSFHFSRYTIDELKNDEEFEFVDEDKKFYVQDLCDDYWEDYCIIEKEAKE